MECRQAGACGESTLLVINPLIYADVSAGFDRIEDLNDALPAEYFRREALPWDAAFLAGKVFLRYRRTGGERRRPYPISTSGLTPQS